jgi:hypothetical protein
MLFGQSGSDNLYSWSQHRKALEFLLRVPYLRSVAA